MVLIIRTERLNSPNRLLIGIIREIIKYWVSIRYYRIIGIIRSITKLYVIQ